MGDSNAVFSITATVKFKLKIEFFWKFQPSKVDLQIICKTFRREDYKDLPPIDINWLNLDKELACPKAWEFVCKAAFKSLVR